MKRILTLMFMMAFLTSFGQYYEIGLQLGGTLYRGDLDAPSFTKNFKNTQLAYGGFIKYNLSGHFGIRGNVTFGKLKGDDAISDSEEDNRRNLNFTSSLKELGLMLEYNIMHYDPKDNDKFFTPYVTAGVAFFSFNPTTTYEGNEYELQPLGTEGQGLPGYNTRYNLTELSIPFGAGVKYSFNEKWSVGFELIWRKTFTDYLDDVSGVYADYDELLAGNGTIAAALSNRQGEYLGQSEPIIPEAGTPRGQGDVKDYYITAMFSIIYNLNSVFGGRGGGGQGCPSF